MALGAVVIGAAVVLFIALKGGDGEEAATDHAGGMSSEQSSAKHDGGAGTERIPTVVIRGGKPVGGVADLTYSEGDRIRFKVKSDVSDEIHVHGYDVMKDVEAGGTVEFDFPATIEGVFEGELENRGEQILELRINP